MKKKILLLFALLSLIVISGCEGVSVLPVQPEESFEEKIVEDVEIISSIWNSLMYDCIPSIGNSESFDSAKEIEVTELAKFAYIKTIRNNGYEVLEKDNQNRFIISKKQIEEVSDKYFNLSEVNFEGIKSHSYIEDSNSFGFYFTPNERIPNYDESNAWGISLESVKQVDKNRYQVELNSYFDSEKQHIQTRWIYQLEDTESNWIILSMEKYFPDNNLINIEGNVETISEIEEYPKSYNDDNMKSISIKDNKMFVSSNLILDGEFTNIFGIINLENMEMEQKIELGDSVNSIKAIGDKFLVKKEREALIIDHNLELVEKIIIPDKITNLIDREVEYDDKHNTLTWYGGYDIDTELERILYSDEEGLKILSLDDETSELLIRTSYFPKDSLSPYGYYYEPKFVLNDTKALFKMAGYESIRDYLILDFAGNDPTYRLDMSKYAIFVNNQEGTKLMALNSSEGILVDLESLETLRLEAEWPLSGDSEMQTSFTQNSSKWFAFSLIDFENNSKRIYKVDIENGEVIGPVVIIGTNISIPEVDLIGILDNGRVFGSYSFFLNERGYFLTD